MKERKDTDHSVKLEKKRRSEKEEEYFKPNISRGILGAMIFFALALLPIHFYVGDWSDLTKILLLGGSILMGGSILYNVTWKGFLVCLGNFYPSNTR